MASYDHPAAQAKLDLSVAITSAALPGGGYVRYHMVTPPFPATLPGEHGETITRYYPGEAARNANDWRRF